MGHHSERSHRRALDRAHAKEGKAFALSDYAEAIRQTEKELGIPIIVLAQFNKDGQRKSEPQIPDIRGSSKVQNDCHLIMFMLGQVDEQVDPFIRVKIKKGREVERNVYLDQAGSDSASS